jgi:hypothetical protein
MPRVETPRGSSFRLLAHGLLAGALLSCLRVPLGLDWTQIPCASGTSAALFRAAALLGLALSLDGTRATLRNGLGTRWLGAVLAGYTVHGFAAPEWLVPDSRTTSVLYLLVFTFCLRSLRRTARPRGADESTGERPRLGRSERLALLLLGVGAALALDTLAREVRLFAPGPASVETLTGTVFLALVFLAALAFGPLLVRLGRDRVRTPCGLALTAAACLVGLVFLSQLTPEGLHASFAPRGRTRRLRALDAKLGVLGWDELPAPRRSSIGTLDHGRARGGELRRPGLRA